MRLIDADVSIEKLKSLPIELDAKTIQRCIEVLSNMSSADRPRGEWVEDTYGWVYCSHCKKYLDDYQMVFFLKPFDYCPNCGADMRGD